MTTTIQRLEICISDVSHWMAANRLKLNADKTELRWPVPNTVLLLLLVLLQARLPGTRCQTISVIRRLAKTLLGDYWRHTCLRCTSAWSAL